MIVEILFVLWPSIITFIVLWVLHRRDRCRKIYQMHVNNAFEAMMARRETLTDRRGWREIHMEMYNFDRHILPMYENRKVIWRMFFGLEWRHCLTGKQRFLAGLYEPEEPPHLTYAMFRRKPWKAWDHPGVYHYVKVMGFFTGERRVYYQGIGFPGGNSTWSSKLVPTGSAHPRKKA